MSKIDLVITALPKSGLHMLKSILDAKWSADTLRKPKKPPSRNIADEYKADIEIATQLRDEEGRICQHIPWGLAAAQELANAKCKILLTRSVGDVIVSHAHYVARVPKETHINYYVEPGKKLSSYQLNDRITCLLPMMRARVESFVKWADEGFYEVRYCDLRNDLDNTLNDLLNHICNCGLDGNIDEMISKSKPHMTSAFRAGRVGDWKKEFTPRQQKYYIEHYLI